MGPTIRSQWADMMKANAINKQFVSVYNKEDVSVPPDLGTSPYDSVAIEDISVEGV